MQHQHVSGPVEAATAAGREAWPSLREREALFRERLAAKLGEAELADKGSARIHPEDLYLACACSIGDDEAIRVFEQRFSRVIDRTVSRFARTDDRKNELKQMLRERLFVAPPGGAPRIASYTGLGFLENWLRVAAVRACLNASTTKAEREQPVREEAFAALVDHGDLELDFLKSHYRGAFKKAFETAVAQLSVEERLLLRLSVVEQLSCDEIAFSLGVHRATAARRTARVRQQLIERTREEVACSLNVEAAELTSMLQLVESNLDLSLSRLLGPADAPDRGES